jgi:hypothetical protein
VDVPVVLISVTLGFGVSSCGFPFSAAVCAFEKKICEDLSLSVQVFSCRDIIVFLLFLGEKLILHLHFLFACFPVHEHSNR